jgi:hypothetical protein
MATFNLDQLLITNDKESLAYSEGHPGAGTRQAMLGQDHFRGPLVDGPHAFLNENATILTANKQERRERILVTERDTVILRGTEYTISKDRYGYLHLTPVEVPATA